MIRKNWEGKVNKTLVVVAIITLILRMVKRMKMRMDSFHTSRDRVPINQLQAQLAGKIKAHSRNLIFHS